ncbi:MAG: tandem-95 repeat protein [Verrucomicrobia bacterium]|nr:tandem-95 repeat protein [Verrucomicrobiota bacterium]
MNNPPRTQTPLANLRLLFVFIAILLQVEVIAGAPACITPPPGLVGWWPAEGNGAELVGSNTAVLLNGATFTNGVVGEAFFFDGVDDRVIVSNAAALNFGPGQNFSIEAWIQPITAVTDFGVQSIVNKRYTPNFLSAVGYEFGLADGKLSCQLADAPLTQLDFTSYTSPGPDLRDGQFHHVAMTVIRSATNGGHLYVDGQVVLTFDPTVQPGDLSTTEPLRIGNHADPALNSHFKGRIDEVAIYNRALSANEIAGIYNAGSAGKCLLPPPCLSAPSSLVSWWKGESNAADTSGGNHGQLAGAITFASGQTGQAFVFDGVDGVITVPASPSLNVGLGAGLTIETWIKPSAIELERPIVEWNSVTGGNPYPYGVHFWISVPVGYGAGPGCLYANLVDTAGNFHWLTSAGGLINTNSFQHVAVTYDESSGLAVLLLNGAVVAQQNLGSFTPQTSYNLYLGARPGGTAAAYRWAGLMDEVSLYSRALNQTEIQSIYNARSAGKCPPAPPPPRCVPTPSGLVSWWRGESDALDSADGNNGTLQNGAVIAAGKVGQAFSLDGVDDVALVADAPNLRFGPTSPMTVDMWVYRTSSNPVQHIIGKRASCTGSSTEGTFQLVFDDAGVGLAFGPPSGACACSGQALPLNTWTHLAGTFDGTTLRLFINGQLAATTPGSLGPANTAPLKIGDSGSCGAFYGQAFGGLIDEVSIYNRALTTNEIQSIYNAGSAGKCPPPPPTACVTPPSGLVSWWRGEGSTADAADGNTGTIDGTGTVTYGLGVVGQAFVFDGTHRDRVTLGNPASLRLEDFTLEAWVKRSSPTVTSFDVLGADGSVAGDGAVIFGYGRGGYGFGIANDGRMFLSRIDLDGLFSAPLVTDTNWHHLAVTKSGSSAVFYVDGAPQATPAYDHPNPFTFDDATCACDAAVAIGSRGDGRGGTFFGMIDEPAVFNRALSATEIAGIYHAGRAGKCLPPPPPYLLAGPITNTANGHWYYLLDATNWPAAEQIAVSLGGHLATINNAAENEWVFTNFGNFGGGDRALWIGLNDAGQENIWFWVSGQPVTYFNWAPGEPNSGGGFFPDEDHVLIWNPSSGFPLGTWTDAPSNQLHSAVIEVGPPDPIILAGPITNTANGHWYYLLNFTNWPAAEQIAVSLGGHLATINNAAENQWVFDTFSTFGGLERPMWIGLNDAAQEGTWVWVSGEPVTYLNWSPIEPNSGDGVFPDEDHVLIWHPSSGFPLGSWNDAPSNQLQYAVVEVAPPAPVIVSQPTNLTVYVGSNATFRVTATGGAPLAYQWRFYETNLPGKTSSVLTVAGAQFSNAGTYSVIVSNAGGSVTSSPALLFVNPLPDCVPPPTGLVSWWRWENDTIDSWDSNNAVPALPAVFSPGKADKAISIQRGIQVPDSPSLRLTNGVTLEAWVNPSSVSGTTPRTIISKFDYPPEQPVGTQSGYLLGTTNNGRLFFTVSATGSARTNTMLVTSQVLPTNQWSFIVATYDGAALRIYVNGALAAQTNYSGGIFPGTANLGLGAIPSSRSFFWPFLGLLDEVSLYNRALTDAEIQAIFNADVVGKCLVAPTIVTQPQDQAVPLGEDVKFSVSVLGSRPLKYQWRFNGQVIPGATNSALVLEKLKTNQAGLYNVSVTNAVGFAISARAELTLLPPPTCTDTPTGLISWWPGDGNQADAMGTNNISSFSPTLYATGKVDRAFSLNGISSRIQVAPATTLNFGSNVDFSIETWIKTGPSNTINPNVPIIEKRTEGTAAWVGYSLSLNQGRLAFAMGSTPLSATNVATFISPGPDLRDGMFHHVAVSLNRTVTNGGNLFVDGQLVLTFDPTKRKASLASSPPLYIGAPVITLSNSYFGGLIDEPAIYNRALSAAEILAIRQAGAAGKCKVKPTILVQPVSQRVTVGSNVTFSVVAAGSPRLRYQWLFSSGQSILGATNSSYSFIVKSGGTFSVRVTNVFGAITSSNAVLTANIVPTAAGDVVTLNEDTPTAIELHGSDRENDPLIYSIATPPAHGTLSGTPPNVIYLPSPDYNGPDSFTFKVNDGLADSAPATINLTVLPVNDPPVAQSQSVALNEDTTAAFTLGAFDVDGDSLTYLVLAPSHGTLIGTPPNLTYQPNTNYFGPDSFTFKVNDGQMDSIVATVSLNVISVNDPPMAKATVSPLAQFPGLTNLVVISPNNSNATVVLDGSQSTDVENDPLQYSWLEGTNVIASGVLATNHLDIGTHTITLVVSDGMDVGTDTAVVEVITPVQSVGILISLVEESTLSRQNRSPLIVTLKAAAASFESERQRPGINQLNAFQNKVRAQVTPLDPALAESLINAAQVIIDALSHNP